MEKYNNNDIIENLNLFCKPILERLIDFDGIIRLYNKYTPAQLKDSDEKMNVRWVYLMTERLLAGVRALANEKEELLQKYRKLEERYNDMAEERVSMLNWYEKDKESQIRKFVREKNQAERECNDLKKYVEALHIREKKMMIENERLKKQVEVLEKTLETIKQSGNINGHYMERIRLENGEKIAYKEQASEEKVYQYLTQGYTPVEMAKQLNVSVGTIYRRIRALKEKGITLPEK